MDQSTDKKRKPRNNNKPKAAPQKKYRKKEPEEKKLETLEPVVEVKRYNRRAGAPTNIERAAGIKQMNTTEMLNEWDAMMVAKHMPGRFNVPYINNMNITSQFTGIISTEFPTPQCYDTSATPVL